MPRWWLATNYDPLLTDADGLAWELRGPGVKAMTEEDFLLANGDRVHSGKASPTAQKWANNMTARYDELSKRDTIFGELRNCMDLAIVAALLFKENLRARRIVICRRSPARTVRRSMPSPCRSKSTRKGASSRRVITGSSALRAAC